MSSPLSGQLPVGGAAAALSATPVTVTAFTVKAPLANAATVYIGPAGVTGSTGFPLEPGDVYEYERNSQNGQNSYQIGPNDVYAIGTSGDRVAWLASP